ncbi:hypothetical protein [Rhizobacter sp. LjRoot28]|uniref:hypothetical protein n=1 Tax=Rhizobacter sp. LjRoot28 TaxID=3342309 RepID=UPI003ECE73B7
MAEPPRPLTLRSPEADATDAEVDAIVERGPAGTFAVAGVATTIVVAIYVAFYFFAYLPRGAVQ